MITFQHSPIRPGKLFCFGLGFTGVRFAYRLRAAGWQVTGTSRNEGSFDRLRADGIAVGPMETADIPSDTSYILSTIPPSEGGDPVLLNHSAKMTAGLDLAWIGYLSTTGVYGDRGGATVCEEDTPAPSNTRSQRRLTAERAWLEFGRKHDVAVQIFRLAGIYGPKRSVLDSVRAGTAKRINKPEHLFSRIHVDDIGTILMASMSRPRASAIYNVCDDAAAAPAEVTLHACRLLGVEPPPLEEFDADKMSPMAQSFWKENRLVSNALVKHELGISLRYPDYRAGLAAILEEEKTK